MRILVSGASGLVGHKVVEVALKRGHEVYSLYREHVVNMGIPLRIDITNGGKLSEVISQIKPHTVIHTAAYTDVDGCEVNRDLAWRVNAEATKK